MSYQNAMKRIQQLEDQLQMQHSEIRENGLNNTLNFNKNAKMGLGLGTAGLRAAAGAGVGSSSGVLQSISPVASAALLAAMPLMAASQTAAAQKRTTEFKAERELLRSTPGSIRGADIFKTGSLATDKMSKIGMNQFMAMMAAGALTGDASLAKAAMVPYAAAGMTGGPLKAASTALGLKAVLAGNASNPITASMAAAPAVLGTVAGGAMKGAGWAATNAGLLAGGKTGAALGAMGGGLSAAGGATQAGGSALMTMGLANPMMAMAMGVATMLLVQPKIHKMMEKIKGGATGQQLLKSGMHQRPRIQQAHMIAMKYSTTRALDQQVNMLGQSQQLKMGEWLTLSYLGSIEKNTSMNRFMVEYIQELDSEKRQGADAVQNNVQSALSQSGIQGLDVSGGFQDIDEINSMEPGLAKTMAQMKRGIMKTAVGFGEAVETYGSFLDPMAYIKGGEDNPFAKMQKMEEQRVFDSTAEKMSEATGLSISFVNALETSATTVANMGNSSQDKLVALAGYNFEVNKISAFKLLDIANAMGVDQKDSFMGKFRDIMEETEMNRDTRKKTGVTGMTRNLLEGVSKMPILPALLAGTAVLTGGLSLGAGAAALAAPAVGAASMTMWSKLRGKKAGNNTLKSDKEALDSVDMDNIMPQPGSMSIDASQMHMASEREKEEEREKQFGMYEHIASMHDMFDNKSIGAYVRYTDEGERQLREGVEEGNEANSEKGSSGMLAGLAGAAGAGIVGLLSTAAVLAFKGLAAVATTFAAPLAILAGVGLAGYAIYDNWDTISGWFVEVKDTVVGWFDGIGDNITAIGNTISEWISKEWFPKWMYPDPDKAEKGQEALNKFNKDFDKRPLGQAVAWVSEFFGSDTKVELSPSKGILLNGEKAFNVVSTPDDISKAKELLSVMSRPAAAAGGNSQAVDSNQELAIVMKTLSENTANIGSVSVGQQNAMIDQLQVLAATIAGGSTATTVLLSEIKERVGQTANPFNFAGTAYDRIP